MSMGTNLAPGLLLAMPQLMDPNFTRSVVLMIEHGDMGSFGLVINQPSPIRASELLGSLEMEWCGADDEVVWAGGPVAPTTGWVLHEPVAGLASTRGLGSSGTIQISDEIDLSTSPDRLRALAASPPRRLRVLLGYSGWARGQLASEMTRGSWLHADADPALIFDTPAADIWTRAMASLGIANPESVVQGRGIH
ncbi:MAG TPA: YqgE/AlgH family protein [Kofleriaceae bacterium]|jgi:putative transcriptional regulator|nr:YqgE/AlgH family protein [Kofleriaceae bacterium]